MEKRIKLARLIFDERLVRDPELVAKHFLEHLRLVFGDGEVEIIKVKS